MLLDLIASLGGLIIPPAFDFIKKKFIKPEGDNPTATLNTLATTKPDIMPAYTTALASLLDAQTRYFNRDVIGVPHIWVCDLRAVTRPIFVWASAITLICDIFYNFQLDPGLRQFMEFIVSSWFGSRINQ
jgi:hypothetical protein